MAGNNNDDTEVTKQIDEHVGPSERLETETIPTNNSSLTNDERFQVNENGYTYTDVDGIVYEWDFQRQAWFPRCTDDLLLSQQAAYGISENDQSNSIRTSHDRTFEESEIDNSASKKEEASTTKKLDEVVRQRKNPNIYVTGLPLDVTLEELKVYFEKCGIIREDFESGQPKIKLYKMENGQLKGDAMISYWKEESVNLATQILDQSEFRPNYIIHVEQASFEPKTVIDPVNSKRKRKIDKLKLKRQLSKFEKKLGWFETESGKKAAKYAKLVILKHMFSPEEIEMDPGIILDLKEDIRQECEKLGPLVNIHIFDKSKEGACLLKFKDEDTARKCIESMNGRWFGGRQIEAQFHDGDPKYDPKKEETTQENEEQRLKQYAEWLESQQ